MSALTAGEWSEMRRYGHLSRQCFDSPWDDDEAKHGVSEISASADSLHLTSHQHGRYATFDAPGDRHALAALCLHEQPFGFTREDVEVLRVAAPQHGEGCSATDLWPGPCDCGIEEGLLNSMADRIEALLPPDESA